MHDDDVQPAGSAPGIRDLLTLGGMLVGCMVVGVGLGLLVDAQPIGVLVGTALGIVAAGFGFWFRIRSFLRG